MATAARVPELRFHGQLPPWGEASLPAPPPFTFRNILRTLGPGVIGLGVAIGSGEWLLGPSVIVAHGPTLLWITTLSVLFQVILNLEMARYTIATGEPIMTGYMRTRPGPTFWGWTYSALSLLQYGWPGWALASATATAALFLGRIPGSADAGLVIIVGYVTFGACVLIVCSGKKVERTVEYAMWVMIAWIFLYLVAVDLTTVSAANWKKIFAGFLTVGALPSSGDWTLLAAFAAYSGLGGMGNAFITNWMRDKGYGMASTVGYIGGASAGSRELAPHGNVFPVNTSSLRAWREWWRYTALDQWGIFAVGSVLGMALTALLTLQHVPAGSTTGGWAVANFHASALAAAHGRIFWHLTLLCGLGILFSTQLGVVDGMPRAVTDMLWSGSASVRRFRGGDVRAIYYLALGAFAAWGCIALNLAQPLTLVLISANIGGANLVLECLHTLVVNRRFLPPELRPALWREAVLALGALFYGTFAVIVLVHTLR
jgi:hypothetical protein